MSRLKLRIKNTQLDNLVCNLRGEVGEIITSWVLLRHIMATQRGMFSDDPAKDMANCPCGDVRFSWLPTPLVENRGGSVRVHQSERLREALALPNGGYLILIGLFKPVRHLDRFPSRHVKIGPFTEDSIE